LQSEIHELVKSVDNKEDLPLGRRIVIIIPIYKKGIKTVVVLWDVTIINFIQNVIQYPSPKF
jgi:hypothetical protein